MNNRQKRQLYETIMKSVAKTVKKSLNEFNIFGVEVPSLQQGKISDIDDADKPVKWNDRQITKDVQAIYDKMKTNIKFKDFMKNNNACEQIEWSYKIDTACTDGHTGRIIINPEYIATVLENAGEPGIQFIILHELMHNYYNNVKHTQKIVNPSDNIIIDRQINSEIIRRWPELKDIPRQLGLLLPN